MGVVDPARQKGGQLPTRESRELPEELVREELGPELLAELVVVDGPLDLVRRDDKVGSFRHGVPTAIYPSGKVDLREDRLAIVQGDASDRERFGHARAAMLLPDGLSTSRTVGPSVDQSTDPSRFAEESRRANRSTSTPPAVALSRLVSGTRTGVLQIGHMAGARQVQPMTVLEDARGPLNVHSMRVPCRFAKRMRVYVPASRVQS